MWVWKIPEGRLYFLDGAAMTRVGQGYSGAGIYKNDPKSQGRDDEGPVPAGVYIIGAMRDTDTHGPKVLPLQPMSVNEMFGRAGFLIHGDSLTEPGTASTGCIILPRQIREKVAASPDKILLVIA